MNSLFHLAYLDPGSGSMIIQSVIGVVAGIGLFGRRAIHEVRAKRKAQNTSPKTDAKK